MTATDLVEITSEGRQIGVYENAISDLGVTYTDQALGKKFILPEFTMRKLHLFVLLRSQRLGCKSSKVHLILFLF